MKGPVAQRSLMCMNLWPSLPEDRARANLRRTLWQLPPGWVAASSWELRLMADVDLDDAHEVAALALTSTGLEPHQVELLRHDLLPGWYEEWLVPEQDQFHLQRIQALEEVCRTATETHDFGPATSAGLAAVCAEPLRESAVAALVAAHLGEGTVCCGAPLPRVRHFLRRELDVEPGAELAALMSPFAGAEPKSRLAPS